MKKGLSFICSALLLHCGVVAQNIPSESPQGKVIQTVGLSDITVVYGRPGVKGRSIFGTLVPYGAVWRTGANFPTFISLRDSFYAGTEKKLLPPGKYALYTIPERGAWTIIFSKDTTLWGAFGYRQEHDLCRFSATADTMAAFAETFAISFTNVADDRASIELHWANTKVSFPVEAVNLSPRVITYLRKRIASGKNPPYRYGASYLRNHNMNPELALEWINAAVREDSSWLNLWVKAETLAWTGDYKEAIALGEASIKQGNKPKEKPYFPYEAVYRQTMAEWGKKSR